MNTVLQFLTEHGVMLAVGATILLIAGCATMLTLHAPIKRQRAGEMTIAAVLLWICLACIPLPRWAPSAMWSPPAQEPAAEIAPPIVDRSVADAPGINYDLAVEEAARARAINEVIQKLNALEPEPASQPTATAMSDDVVSDAAVAEVLIDGIGAEDVIAAEPGVDAANVTRPSADSSAESWLTWQVGLQLVTAAYLVGIAGCLLWLLLGRMLLWSVTRRADVTPAWLAQLYESLSAERLPRLLVTAACRRAFSYGWWRPTIVLPAECCREDRREQLRQILLHELAHLRHGDQRGRVLFNVALPLLYVHPLYWWIRGRTYLAAELLADDWAAGHSSTAVYAGELIALVKEQGRRGLAHVGTVGIFSSPTQFYRRMEMLVRRKTPLMNRCSRRWRMLTLFSAVACVVLLSGLLGVGLVQAEADGTDDQADDENVAEAAATNDTEAKPATDDDKPAKEVDTTSGEASASDAKSTSSTDVKKPAAGVVNQNQRDKRGFGLAPSRKTTSASGLGRSRSRRGDDGDDRRSTSSQSNPPNLDPELADRRNRLRGRGGRTRADDDDDGGRFSAGGLRVPVARPRGAGRGFGRERDDEVLPADQLLAKLKSLHRDVLIQRLKFLSRRPAERVRQIGKLLETATVKIPVIGPEGMDTTQISDEQLIAELYNNVLRQKPDEAELKIVRQIFKLSDNRLDTIYKLLESKGHGDDATKAAVMTRELEALFANIERELPNLAKRIESPLVDGENEENRMRGINNEYRTLDRARARLKRELYELSKLDKKLGSSGSQYYPPTLSPTPVYGIPKVQPPVGQPEAPVRVQEMRRVIRERKLPDGKVVHEEIQVPETLPPTVPSKPKKTPKPAIYYDSSTPALPAESWKSQGDDPKKRTSKAPNNSSEWKRDPVRSESRQKSAKPDESTRSKSAPNYAEPDRDSNYEDTPKMRDPVAATPALSSTDPISLAVDYSTTRSKQKQAEIAFDRISKLHERGATTAVEFEKAQADLAAHKQRLEILMQIADVLKRTGELELQAIQIELERALGAKKSKDQVRIAQLRAKMARIEGNLKILKTIKPAKKPTTYY